jgi:hypothetical protein
MIIKDLTPVSLMTPVSRGIALAGICAANIKLGAPLFMAAGFEP